MQTIDLLDEDTVRHVGRHIHALREHWIARAPVPFFTLGAATYLDVTPAGRDRYVETARRHNALLTEHFAWLHEAVLAGLERVLGTGVQMAPGLALPGFHIFEAHPAFTRPLASVHLDLQYQQHSWEYLGPPDYEHPVSFTLAITLPAAGGGLLVWPQGIGESRRLSARDMEAALRNQSPSFVPYRAGAMVVHDGHLVHQIAPLTSLAPGDERITLQGHAIRCGPGWYAYW
jgi:hypothetical protein